MTKYCNCDPKERNLAVPSLIALHKGQGKYGHYTCTKCGKPVE